LHDQFVTGEYWVRHGIPKRLRPEIDGKLKKKIDAIARATSTAPLLPWRTVRDCLVGLPDPEKTSGGIKDHRFQPGARSYPGHTGSPLDLPAKTLKAGGHGVPGGENMMVKHDGSVRYFTIRESARVQTFPDGYVFHGAWGETMRQLGNAVPVALAHKVASSVAEQLAMAQLRLLERSAGSTRKVA
jgi:DNA (cytosine-5)-methyltransferase 1